MNIFILDKNQHHPRSGGEMKPDRIKINKAIADFKARGGKVTKIDTVEDPKSVSLWEDRFFGGSQDPFNQTEIDVLRLTK